ncbi:hypothetical protein DES53_11627 [Roseimicrobium gellanilyticum]|uniref:Uncharacterized protein n=1 Tax=Roseimicrobium gellanilyticum TaxID=748857 RepID=A0A366H590_9BACT|nr:hypothetical protein DES53_11627 [Roseimicrobium gellanilyticum]
MGAGQAVPRGSGDKSKNLGADSTKMSEGWWWTVLMGVSGLPGFKQVLAWTPAKSFKLKLPRLMVVSLLASVSCILQKCGSNFINLNSLS